MAAEAPKYLIHPDDVLSARVYGVKEFDVKVRVDEDGYATFPLIGNVKLAGLSVQKGEEAIDQELLAKDMIIAPSTTIELQERPQQQVTVSGDVAKPGLFPATGRHTISDYLTLAGELKDSASSTITLIRPSLGHPVSIPLGVDPMRSEYRQIPIFAGDEIHASSVGFIYVIGALKTQGAYPLKNSTPTTVIQAITLAGGIGFEAAASSTQLVRTEHGVRTWMHINVSKIMAGKAPDIALRNDDILYVPTNEAKAAVKGGATGLIVSLASTYIYAHP
jgi:polysaccharide export outer membrane protein